MIILALDTAGVACAAAIYNSGSDTMLGEASDMIGKGHAEHLMGIVERVLHVADRTLSDVERIAVTVGPGSFTGIRVGVAAARGFALSLGVPAVGVTTLHTMAAAHLRQKPGRPVIAAMDAKRGEIYLQSFDATGVATSVPMALTLEEAQALVSAFDGDITGSATRLLREHTDNNATDDFPISVVARLGAAAPVGHKPKPLYLRGPDAKPQDGFAVARV